MVAVRRGPGGDRLRRAGRRAGRPRAGRLRGADLLGERELWRVEAGRGPGRRDGARRRAVDGGGVFDLAFDWSDGRWALVGCAD